MLAETLRSRPSMLTIPEVAALLRRDQSTINRLVRSGKLPAIRVGREWLIEPDVLLAFLDARRVGSAAESRQRAMPTMSASQRRTP